MVRSSLSETDPQQHFFSSLALAGGLTLGVPFRAKTTQFAMRS
jgi:hypothetical protein